MQKKGLKRGLFSIGGSPSHYGVLDTRGVGAANTSFPLVPCWVLETPTQGWRLALNARPLSPVFPPESGVGMRWLNLQCNMLLRWFWCIVLEEWFGKLIYSQNFVQWLTLSDTQGILCNHLKRGLCEKPWPVQTCVETQGGPLQRLISWEERKTFPADDAILNGVAFVIIPCV